MANGYSAGDLYLNIDSVATDTLKNLDAVIDRLNIINRGLGSINKSSKLADVISPKQKSNSKTKSFFNNFLKLSRWTAILYVGKRIGSEMANIVTAGSDFGETLNLWKVAMGNEFLPQATEFVNKLNEAYGVSKKLLMDSQAIFKNMLGSLGQISDETAYQLSEGITQMALDYASLYNVKFEDAMTKFQAALAGQVRPIRSVAGYDITENTLFQLYQMLGGEKTMRQLTRTEKQLLAIYAVFEQMGRSGATGDLERTINSFANQSRVFRDSWRAVLTYAGLTTTRILEQYHVLQYINAVLIFMSRLLEGLAASLDTGLGNSGEVFGDMENSINSTTNAVENLKSSLLDFDKFRALDQSSGVDDELGIDESILNGLSQYNSILDNASLKARELADAWLEALGFVDKNNDGVIEVERNIFRLQNLINKLDFKKAGENLSSAITDVLKNATSWLSVVPWAEMGTAIGDFINEAKWDELILASWNFSIELADGVAEAIAKALVSINWFELIYSVIKGVVLGIESRLNSLFGTDLQGALSALFDFMEKRPFLPNFAKGGLPDKGTMFVAGEAGAEMVYNMPNGQSGVANVRQIEQAMYNALSRHQSQQSYDERPIVVYLDGEKVYESTTARAKAQGFVWAKA